ncbi:NUDIX domain-containing protein [Numidum massiliense]|uniref:NUDIX domain-containing protein n=1 Tax=Numidum massiliense TaxID=1522315 RepID=UPI0006D5711E|nr:NUDIX domain-containing protein [Numidum massiliense]
MYYRRKTYKIKPDKLETFNAFFHEYLLPNQLKHGTELIGRWVTEDGSEIVAIWKYKDKESYEQIEARIRRDPLHRRAQQKLQQLGQLFEESKQDFLRPTGDYVGDSVKRPFKMSVSVLVTNDAGEVLLVKDCARTDTWELPGGKVESGERLDLAVQREVLEETGATIRLKGVSAVYQKLSDSGKVTVTITFQADYVSGHIQPHDPEIVAADFIVLDEDNLGQYVTRPHLQLRVLDAMRLPVVTFSSYQVTPFELVSRLNVRTE